MPACPQDTGRHPPSPAGAPGPVSPFRTRDSSVSWGFCRPGADGFSREPAGVGGVPLDNHTSHCTHMTFPGLQDTQLPMPGE